MSVFKKRSSNTPRESSFCSSRTIPFKRPFFRSSPGEDNSEEANCRDWSFLSKGLTKSLISSNNLSILDLSSFVNLWLVRLDEKFSSNNSLKQNWSVSLVLLEIDGEDFSLLGVKNILFFCSAVVSCAIFGFWSIDFWPFSSRFFLFVLWLL